MNTPDKRVEEIWNIGNNLTTSDANKRIAIEHVLTARYEEGVKAERARIRMQINEMIERGGWSHNNIEQLEELTS